MGFNVRDRLSALLPRRRAHRVVLATLILLTAAWFVVPQLFVPMIRGKLQGMIASHLDAKLEIGRLMYAPPFGVRARDVRLVSGSALGGETAGTELLKVRKLDLKLARSPFYDGPLIIQNITVHDPEVHLIRMPGGRLVGMDELVRKDSPTVRATTQPATLPASTRPAQLEIESPAEAERDAARARLSDMFELRHFGIHGGRVVYEDRSQPGLPPVVWRNLDVGMETTPREKGVYGYTFDARHGKLARLQSSGSFNLDQLVLDLGSLRLDARTQYTDDESPLPAQVQRALRDYRVEGRITLDAHGRFDLRDPAASSFRATMDLGDASGYFPEWDATLDRLAMKVGIDNWGADPPGRVRIRLDAFEAASGDSTVRIDKGAIIFDRASNTWDVAEVAARIDLGREGGSLPKKSRPVLARMNARGELQFSLAANGKIRPGEGEYALIPEDLAFAIYPRGVSLQPKSPAPLQDFGGGGSIRKKRGSRVVIFEDLACSYGGDPVVLTSARLQLPPRLSDLAKQTRIEEISGSVDFRRPGPRYPGKFGAVVDTLRPVGLFTIGRDSWFGVTKIEPDRGMRNDPALPPPAAPSRRSDWYFSVATDSASFTLTDERISLLNMKGDATVSNLLVDVRRLEADMLGGKLTGTLQVTPGSNLKYQGRAYLRHIDLDAVSKVYILPETEKAKLTGEGNLDIAFSGSRPRDGRSAIEALAATGEFEILRGHFWTLPLLGEVARRAGGGRAMTVGEAAGVFDVANQRILLRSAAVSSPALGVQGSGTITLDRQLDLNLVAAPLGDWRDKVKGTNIPLVSNVAGELAGALQKIVNVTASNLLYEFRITGTTGSPNVATVPAPALTDAAAALFGGMLGSNTEGHLLQSVKSSQANQRAAPPPDPGR